MTRGAASAPRGGLRPGRVWLVGGGPGAHDLLTLRGAAAIAAADVVIWGRDLLDERVATAHARPDAELIPWPPATMRDIHAAYDRAAREGLRVARLHWGDPTIYSKLGEELAAVRDRGLEIEVVPGVGALAAAGAALECELTGPGEARPLVIAARPSGEGQFAPPPEGARIAELASLGATMALFMAGADPAALAADLAAGGFGEETPCAVVHRASWGDERVVRCALGELAARLEELDTARHTLVIAGPALAADGAG